MQDWHNEADEKLFALRENHESVTYHCMIEYFEAVYEREKENMVISTDPTDVNRHWIAANGVRSLLDDLRVTEE